MITSSLNEIKTSLAQLDKKDLLSICLRLGKFKKENKELLTFLLFEANDLDNYIESIKKEITSYFGEINNSNVYFVKKSVRKILRYVNKNIRIAASKQAEAEILIHFCNGLLEFKVAMQKSKPLLNILKNQLKKIDEVLSGLHPDLQYDLRKQLKPAQVNKE